MTKGNSSPTGPRRCICRVSAGNRRSSTHRAASDLFRIRQGPSATLSAMRVVLSLLALRAAAVRPVARHDRWRPGDRHAPCGTHEDAQSCGNLPCDAIYVARAGNDTAAGTRCAGQDDRRGDHEGGGAGRRSRCSSQAGEYAEPSRWWRARCTVASTRPGRESRDRDRDQRALARRHVRQIKTGTALDRVTIKSGDATQRGRELVCGARHRLEVDHADTRHGRAGDRRPRASTVSTARPARNGGNGKNGSPGCENSGGFCSSCSQPTGGAGGTSACGRTGGKGGNAGQGGNAGGTGSDGVGLAAERRLRRSLGRRQIGTPGGTGADGSTGGPGGSGLAAGDVGMFNGAVYVGPKATRHGGGPAPAAAVVVAAAAARPTVTRTARRAAAAAAAAAAAPGTGGCGGGGSFGVVAVDSQVTIKSSMVLASHGGAGGRGGRGGNGGARRPGRAGRLRRRQ